MLQAHILHTEGGHEEGGRAYVHKRGEMEEEEWPTRGKVNERRDVYVRERHTQELDTEKSERGGRN